MLVSHPQEALACECEALGEGLAEELESMVGGIRSLILSSRFASSKD